jgi:hypothetical protein
MAIGATGGLQQDFRLLFIVRPVGNRVAMPTVAALMLPGIDPQFAAVKPIIATLHHF